MKSKLAVAVAAGAMLFATGAMAADPIMPAAPPPPPPAAPPAFSWTGPYIGAYGGYWFGDGGMVGGLVGYNYQINNYVIGIDVSAGIWDFTGPDFEAYAIFRGGLAVGRVLAYAGIGPGWSPVSGLNYAATAGVEFAVTDRIILRGEAIVYEPFTNAVFGIRGGVSLLFGGM